MNLTRAGIPIILFFLIAHLVLLGVAWFSGQMGLWRPLYYLSLGLAVVLGVLTAFSLYFFRDPERLSPPGEHLVVSPADGRVLGVDEIEQAEWIGGKALRVSIFMSVFSVHVNRFPVGGTVRHKLYRPGKFINASLDKASDNNEAMSIGVLMEDGTRVLVRQIAGLIARRIVCDVDEGDTAMRGARFGMIRFGSRVEVYLPPGSQFKVSRGDMVTAGETILAELP